MNAEHDRDVPLTQDFLKKTTAGCDQLEIVKKKCF